MKVVFIAYFFKPYPGVGAQRLTYWADNANDFDVIPEVITTIDQNIDSSYKVHVVKNTNQVRKLSKVIKDQGYSWYLDLNQFISCHNFNEVDAFVISGGPFMHFEIAKDLKKRYPKSKIIFDYRDPFGYNPRFNDRKFKSSIKKYYERKHNRYADIIITVNNYCANYLQTNKPISIIDNGYDETAFNGIELSSNYNKSNQFRLAHAGSLYADRNPTNLLKVITSGENVSLFSFDQFGAESNFLDPFLLSDNVNYLGRILYKDLIKKLTSYDAVTLFTSGDPFESTTKIFDYMALNQRILIVTEGEVKTGALNEITKSYPNIIWVVNQQEEINKALNKLRGITIQPFDATPFSRRESLRKFIELIKK